MAEGIDYSWARPGAAAIKAAGKSFIMRYLYADGIGGKGLDLAEVQDARANGLLIGLFYESSGTTALGGFAAGVADATAAQAQLVALGMVGTVVYFAVDFNETADQYPVTAQYLDGAASVIGKDKTGLYAGFGPIDALCGGAHADYGCQTYAWSKGLVSKNANLYQYLNGQTLNGGSVDYERNLTDDFGAFGGTAVASAPGSTGGSALATNLTSLTWQQIQHLLNTFGYNLVEDNIDGPNTTAAVGEFQAAHGLTKDFAVGPLTLAALQKVPATPSPTSAGLVVDGIFGAFTVRALQNALHVTADGIIGQVTIKALQARCGAVQDGIMGVNTRKAVQGHVGVPQDGIWGPVTIKAIQTRLNAGTF